jgi:hypothetical protein
MSATGAKSRVRLVLADTGEAGEWASGAGGSTEMASLDVALGLVPSLADAIDRARMRGGSLDVVVSAVLATPTTAPITFPLRAMGGVGDTDMAALLSFANSGRPLAIRDDAVRLLCVLQALVAHSGVAEFPSRPCDCFCAARAHIEHWRNDGEGVCDDCRGVERLGALAHDESVVDGHCPECGECEPECSCDEWLGENRGDAS